MPETDLRETDLRETDLRETDLRETDLRASDRNVPMDLVLLAEITLRANVLLDLMVRVDVRDKGGREVREVKSVPEQGCRHFRSLWCLIAIETARFQKKR
jgi:uncharacterized protein YjbI with pentapeptide repeats